MQRMIPIDKANPSQEPPIYSLQDPWVLPIAPNGAWSQISVVMAWDFENTELSMTFNFLD